MLAQQTRIPSPFPFAKITIVFRHRYGSFRRPPAQCLSSRPYISSHAAFPSLVFHCEMHVLQPSHPKRFRNPFLFLFPLYFALSLHPSPASFDVPFQTVNFEGKGLNGGKMIDPAAFRKT